MQRFSSRQSSTNSHNKRGSSKMSCRISIQGLKTVVELCPFWRRATWCSMTQLCLYATLRPNTCAAPLYMLFAVQFNGCQQLWMECKESICCTAMCRVGEIGAYIRVQTRHGTDGFCHVCGHVCCACKQQCAGAICVHVGEPGTTPAQMTANHRAGVSSTK
jgi:hypothetical protein